MARPSDPELREKILTDCYKALIKARSFNLTIHELAERVGSSGRMLIYHFESKKNLDELLIAMIESHFRDEFLRFNEAHDDDPLFLVHFWDHMTGNRNRLALLRLSHDVTCHISQARDFQKLATSEVNVWVETLTRRFASTELAMTALLLFQGAITDLMMTNDPANGRLALQRISELIAAKALEKTSTIR